MSARIRPRAGKCLFCPCIAGPNSSSPPSVKHPQTPKSPATSFFSAPVISANSAPASTPTSSSATAPINKIIAIVREEMDRIGQEFFLPAINPKEIWEASGRWSGMGDNMFRLKDRKGAELCLAMTHEEIVTDIARKELRSYKQLPQIWYQIQTKFRDEPRPKSGLLRVRQFLMKDAYSFDIDEAGLDLSYNKHDDTYRRIFTRCGLQFVAVEADSGAMGGSQSQEFMVYTEAGEDLIVSCPESGYAANLEKATSQLSPVTEMEPTGDGLPELVHTPGKAAIAEVAEFFSISPSSDIKTVAYMGQKRDGTGKTVEVPVIAFLRGDHFVNETKLMAAAYVTELRTMVAEELALYFEGPAGYLGPIGLKVLPAAKGDPRAASSSSTSDSKAARTWSAEPTSSTTTTATSPPAATSPGPASPTSATSTKATSTSSAASP